VADNEQPDWEKIMQGLDEFREVTRAMRAAMMSDGWTQAQAQDLVASCFRSLHDGNPPDLPQGS